MRPGHAGADGTGRSQHWLQGVPLIVIAATMPPASRLVALSPVHKVHKPLTVDVLLARVRESLGSAGVPQKGKRETISREDT